MSFNFTFEVKRGILVAKLIDIINMVTGYRNVLMVVLINIINEKNNSLSVELFFNPYIYDNLRILAEHQ